MIDLQLIRNSLETVQKTYREVLFDEDAARVAAEVAELDGKRRQVVAAADQLKAQRNSASAAVGHEKDPAKRQQMIAEMDDFKGRIAQLDQQVGELDGQVDRLMLQLPNLPDPQVPPGKNDTENRVVREIGEKRIIPGAKPHWELGEKLGILDFERGVKVSGSRFYMLKGGGAKLQRALINWMLDIHIAQGYSEIYPPYMVKGECMVGTGQLPKFGENSYRDAEEDFYFVPTAEVPVTNMYRDEVLPAESLPIKHVAYTACFRREKMSHGKDVRGIKRGHQFDKVEMVKFVSPETSNAELESLIADAEEILKKLELPYRVIEMVTGDLSFTACRKFDLEVWAPGCGEWLEVSSCSNFGDFQARRARIRAKSGKDKPRFVHTLNGSGLALPRVMIAVMETYQQPDGSIVLPKVLAPYLHGLERVTS
jgi:seryl-tRNA synthetase